MIDSATVHLSHHATNILNPHAVIIIVYIHTAYIRGLDWTTDLFPRATRLIDAARAATTVGPFLARTERRTTSALQAASQSSACQTTTLACFTRAPV